MPLTKEERIDIILLAGSGTTRYVARTFNATHRTQITHDTVAKLIKKFKRTGSVADASRSGRPKTATDEGTSTQVLAAMARSPTKGTRRLSAQMGISQSSVMRILRANKWHPYKLQMLQHLTEDDPDRRVEFCEWALNMHENVPGFVSSILFSDEANFYVSGEVNKQNVRYWMDSNPHWMSDCKSQGAEKLMVWCGIWGDRIVGPFFIEGNLNAMVYLDMLKNDIIMSILDESGDFPAFFQQDGAPPHYGTEVRQWLDQQFPGHWIGRRGPVEWPPRSPDLTPMDFYLWGHLKSIVYQQNIRNVDHLKRRITLACQQITGETLSRVRQNWLERLSLCVDMEGRHVEHIL